MDVLLGGSVDEKVGYVWNLVRECYVWNLAFCLPLLASARLPGLPAKSSRGRPLAPGFWV